MFGSRRRVGVAGLALVFLLAGFLRGVDPGGGVDPEHGAGRGAAAVVDAATFGPGVAVVRLRTSLISDFAVDGPWTKYVAPGLLWLGAVASWWLTRRDRGAGAPRPRRSSVALRAPPALAFS